MKEKALPMTSQLLAAMQQLCDTDLLDAYIGNIDDIKNHILRCHDLDDHQTRHWAEILVNLTDDLKNLRDAFSHAE